MRKTRGFTAVELVSGVAVIGVLSVAAYVLIGRVFVEKYDATVAAQSAGLTNVRITARHDALQQSPGCEDGESVAFSVEGGGPDGGLRSGIACCGTWPTECSYRQ